MKLGISIAPEGLGRRWLFHCTWSIQGQTASAFLCFQTSLIGASCPPWSLHPRLRRMRLASFDMDDRPANAGFHPQKWHKNFLSKALKTLNKVVPPFFSAAHVISPLVKAHRHLTCQEALYHVHGTMSTMSNCRRSGSFAVRWNQAIVVFSIFSFQCARQLSCNSETFHTGTGERGVGFFSF